MTKYITRRLLLMLLTLFGVSLITFGIMFLVPTDPAAVIAGEKATNEMIASVRQRLGLDQPIYVQYLKYVWRVIHGDLGRSWYFKKPVSTAILEKLPATLKLALACSLLQVVIGVW